jgi:hypothetical protein
MTQSTPEGKLLDIIRNAQSKVRIGRDLKIFTKINIILIGIIGVVAVIFLADVFVFKEKPSVEPVILDKPIAAEKIEEDNAAEQASQDKNINIKKISKEGIIGNFNLLGIITGDNNQAIIEDKSLKKTFFLYKGDSLGELKVYDIKDSVVILDYEGEKIELTI